ncbi:MAG: RNA polymerase sigma factor [Planctomycetota bacterium]
MVQGSNTATDDSSPVGGGSGGDLANDGGGKGLAADFADRLQASATALRTFARRLAGQSADADDVCQEALTRAWRLRHSFEDGASMQPWLRRIAFRVFCDLRKQNTRQPASASDALPASGTEHVSADADRYFANRSEPGPRESNELSQRLARLSTLERELLLAFHRDDTTITELAARHAMPVNTIKSHLHRARKRLRQVHRQHEEP